MIRDVLEREYGIHADEIGRTQGGWSAEAWRIEAREGRFFLKDYDASRPSVAPWVERMKEYVPAMQFLQEQEGLGAHMPKLIPALQGQSSVQVEEHVFLLFEYVDGEVPGERKLTEEEERELAGIFASLHRVERADMPQDEQPRAEDISIPFCGQLERALSDRNGMPERMRNLLTPWKNVLLRAAGKTVFLRDQVRSRAENICLCHTDAHNWNLIQGERLYLLDWEGLCLAPPEADLYAFCAGGQGKTLIEHYLKLRPEFHLNEELVLFYALRRRLEDIWAFMDRLMREQLDTEAEEASYRFMLEAAQETNRLMKGTE